jgi:hypothetical protein
METGQKKVEINGLLIFWIKLKYKKRRKIGFNFVIIQQSGIVCRPGGAFIVFGDRA